MNSMENCQGPLIGDVLQDRAISTPDRIAYSFAHEQAEGTLQEEVRTYAALNARVDILSGKLARPSWFQERAILFFQPGLAYIEAFFACLRAGVIAVPAYPPRSTKNNQRNRERLETMVADAQPRLALTTAALYARLADLRELPVFAALDWLIVDDPHHLSNLEDFTAPACTANHIAFLQYTSGSTSTPKGVIITQGNLMANEAMIQEAFATSPETTCVGWLPLYHDMGLIGNIIQPIYAGFTCHLMAPTTFLRQPILWLDAVHRHRAVISGGPNFAYELCTQKISEEQSAHLDLSSWRVAFNGSEPIRSETLNAFAARFAPAGFSADAFFPCYGLAESTLMISGKGSTSPMVAHFNESAITQNAVIPTDAGEEFARALVGSGNLCKGQTVRIVAPETHQTLPEGQIGEIWAAGPHIARGYWQQSELTKEMFGAHTSDTGEGPFMRTGDLGFFHDGELFITGRLKELIILRGRNLYPQDIERTVASAHEALPPDCGAAFTTERNGHQELVVVQEVARTLLRGINTSEVIEAIQAAVSEAHEVALHAVVLIRPASLPKTTSGKIRRNRTRELYLEGALQELGGSRKPAHSNVDVRVPDAALLSELNPEAQQTQYLGYLLALLARTLETALEEVAPDRPVSGLGLDSLATIDLVQTLRKDLQVDYPLETLLEGPTPAEMAEWLITAPRMQAPAPIEVDPTACSINQRALWLLHQFNPTSTAYHIPVAVRVPGGLQMDRLQTALNLLCERHPMLRTRFQTRDGEPRLETLTHFNAEVRTVIATGMNEAELREAVLADAGAPLSLGQPPWRLSWYDQGSQGGVLLLVCHHIIADMWSMLLFFRELGNIYGNVPLQPAPTVDYAVFTARQQQMLASPHGEVLLNYWRTQMSPAPQTLVLPTDFPRPSLQSNQGASHDFGLGPVLAKQTRAYAAAHGYTPFVVLLTVWQILLHRYSGQNDINVGSPTAGRLDGTFRNVLGDFVNPVVFRGNLAGNPEFGTLVARMNDVVRGGLAHQDFPFERLVEHIHPHRDPSFSPVFQAMFSLQKPQDLPDAAAFILGDRDVKLNLGGLTVTPFALPQRASQVDMALVIVDDNRLPARLVYNCNLFEEATALQWANHYRNLLGAFLAEPRLQIDTPALFAAPERVHLLTAFNQSASPVDPNPLHRRFEAVVAHEGVRTAMLFGQPGTPDHSLSYAELNRRANCLARLLRDRGVGPEQRVGVCLERRPEMVVALLAVLKAGGAYVPLDPNHPSARTHQILEDAGIQLLLTETDQLPRYTTTAQTLTPDQFGAVTNGANLEDAVGSAHLAYVIYTSGSTGKPKGVQLTHHSLMNFLDSMAQKPGIDANDTLLAVTTVSFDIAGLELYLPLLHGARLVLATQAEVTDGRALAANIARNQVTQMQATPATWRLLLEAGFKGELKALCGGEALPGVLARDLLAAGVDLYNMYGPTETTIWSAVRRITQPARQTEAVGGAIANTQLYVADSYGQPQPFGIAGQLLIGGEGLARGYLNRPALTAEKFIPDAFGKQAGARLYQTGDLVRQRHNGDIEFLGRMDFQVKLHGFRIEIGEIEAALNSHPDIAEGVVALVGNSEMGKLAAWITLQPSAELAHIKRERVELNRVLRAHLRRYIPDYMVPAVFTVLDKLPLTPNNKVDRKALPTPLLQTATATPQPIVGLAAQITDIWREFLGTIQVGPNDNFFDLGGNSMMLSRVNNRLKERLNREITMVELFQFPTVSALAAHLGADAGAEKAAVQKTIAAPNAPIAIVGMACRFPGAPDIATFWANLRDGKSAMVTYTDEQLLAAGVRPDILDQPHYVRTGGFLDNADGFDAQFFDFSPLDASLIDPQQRVFLEVCWHALEDGGVDPNDYSGAVGVFAGSGMNTYLSSNLLTQPGLMETEGEYRIMTTNDKDFLATRVAYKLNLRGPAINVQTACSTSLVAVHEACGSLRAGECDMALAGGVTIRVPLHVGYLYRDGLVFSPDGHCRAFDKDAGGTVPGSGAAVVLLKRLDEAQADGDNIVAVIKGSAVNNDAALKVGYTAPGVEGQRKAILAAQANAGVHPNTITYVEAHGTGTKMGDPIEIAALTAAFRTQTDATGFCALGSVKTNIGHLDTAAGVAGLIKTALALKHGYLPASLNYREPNPEIGFERTPFYVNAAGRAWTTEAGVPRRAAVSSFGIGGTNAHAILEEAPISTTLPQVVDTESPQLLLFSARSAAALDALTVELAGYLEREPTPLAQVAAGLAQQRKRFDHRRFVVGSSAADVSEALKTADPKRVFSRRDDTADRGLVFMFPGQGAQYPGMSRALYDSEPNFRALVDHCCEILTPKLGLDLRSLIYPAADQWEQAADQLRQTQFTQPALFVVEYALAQLLLGWGLQPRALVGHSVGEYVAATLAGVFQLEDALSLVAERGRLIAGLPGGSMLSVPLTEAALKPHLNEDLSLAAVNAPDLCVVSGPHHAIDALAARLELGGTDTRRLHTSHAFHSHMMEPILAEFTQLVAAVAKAAPQRPVISNLSGLWLSDEQATDPAYWTQHLRREVRFADGLTTLFQDADTVLVEVGPGRTLTSLARRLPQRGASRVLLSLLPTAEGHAGEKLFFLEALGKLWLTGAKWDGTALFGRAASGLNLPKYPFQRERFWIEPGEGTAPKKVAVKVKDPADWFYAPSWKRTAAPAAKEKVPAAWLIFSENQGPGAAFASLLEQQGHRVVRVAKGTRFLRVGEDRYTLDHANQEEFAELISVLAGSGRLPEVVVHFGNMAAADHEKPLQTSFYEPLYLVRALSNQDAANFQLVLATAGMQDVAGEGVAEPYKALTAGLMKVVPQEHKHISCRLVDFGAGADDIRANQLYREICAEVPEPVVAWRGRHRWERYYEAVRLPAPERNPLLIQGGCYLITGGLGGIGLAVADYLAKTYKARLVLLGRKAPETRETWPEALVAMEAAGAAILPLKADVANAVSLDAAVAEALKQFGRIDGVFHAAGLPGGGALKHREPAHMNDVLAPKVAGTLNLERALAKTPPGFMCLFSSVNAVLGGFGQADYAAANAFLDAFAHARQEGPTRVFSINWDSWHTVGMAVAALEQATGKVSLGAVEGTPCAYPLFDAKSEEGNRVTYVGHLDVNRHWPLNEHWILDRAILPGTTYLDMARAAMEDHVGRPRVAFRDVAFLTPLVVPQGTTVRFRTVLERKGAHFQFTVASLLAGGVWREHATGQLHLLEEAPGRHDLEALKAAHQQQVIDEPLQQTRLDSFHIHAGERNLDGKGLVALRVVTDGKEKPEVSIELGRRWDCARKVMLGETSGLAEMALDADFAEDLEHFKLHPAILDFAVGYLRLFKKQANFLPLSYERLSLFQPLPAKLYSYIRFADSYQADRGNPIFDVFLLDMDGVELARIEGFALGRIDGARLEADEKAAKEQAAELAAFTRHWLSPVEGVDAMLRILAADLPQVVVSTRSLATRLEEVSHGGASGGSIHGAGARLNRPIHPRPDLMNPFVAPRDQHEAEIAAIWADVIGLEKVGIHDDFNDLGGDSLLITRIHAQMKDKFQTEISVAELMQYPNVADISAYMRRQDQGSRETGRQMEDQRRARQTQSLKSQNRMKMARTRNPLSRSGK